MTYDEFITALSSTSPPAGMSTVLQALWYDRIGQWDKSHDLISDLTTTEAAHVHAYLHRKEGDLWNADYWYKRAQRPRPEMSLDEEWQQLVQHFL